MSMVGIAGMGVEDRGGTLGATTGRTPITDEAYRNRSIAEWPVWDFGAMKLRRRRYSRGHHSNRAVVTVQSDDINFLGYYVNQVGSWSG